ncbi:MAG: hypothetical protein ACI4E1_10615 [Lachnospira sp.]
MGACVGILDIFELTDKSSDIVVLGSLKGTLKVGAAVYISNVGDDESSTALTTVLGIEVAPNTPAEEATDRQVGLLIKDGAKMDIRKGSVLFERDTPASEVRDAYVNALGDEFIGRLNLKISDSDMDKLTFSDCVELWKLFRLYKDKIKPDKTEEEKEQSQANFSRLAQAVINKLFALKKIYCLINKKTGEPHMLTSTYLDDNESYHVSPPNILLFTKSQMPVISRVFTEDNYTYQLIENDTDSKNLYNYLGEAFYLNGACGVFLQDSEVSIASSMLVEEPDYSDLPQIKKPVTNPSLERWLLLIGQLGTPDSPDKETIYKIYYRFMARELVKAKFLIPIKHTGDIPAPDAEGKTVLDKGIEIQFSTLSGKDSKDAVRMYTDWKRLKMGVGEGYEGMIQTVGEMINVYDCAINVTEYLNAGCYVSKEMFDEMSKMNG